MTIEQAIGGVLAALAVLLMVASIYAGVVTPPADRHRLRDEDDDR